jgi:hypothetical protein
MTMKYIFLDFDGVMNSAYYFMSNTFRRGTAGLTAADIMLTKVHHTLCPKLVRKVNDLVKDSGAKVIVSSTWRLKYSDDELNEFLALRGATFKIDGRTPIKKTRMSEYNVRGDEILMYLKSLSEIPEGIVILDDISDMNYLNNYLCLVDGRIGFTQQDARIAINILNTKFIMPEYNND